MESPSNTWGPLLKLQEIKEIFTQSSGGKSEECQNVPLKKFNLNNL